MHGHPKKNIHSIVNSVVVNNQMQKGKKKNPKWIVIFGMIYTILSL